MLHKKNYSKIQLIRFIVQLIFFIAFFIGLIHARQISSWILPTALIIGVFFCGWVCALGSTQDWLWKLGRLMHLPEFKIPGRIQRFLQLSRYILYFLSLAYAFNFAISKGPHNFNQLLHGKPLTIAIGFIICLLVLSLFTPRPFCNYFCTGGAKQGLFSVLRIFGIRKNQDKCVNCRACTKACPMNIDVATADFVRHPNCISCMSCISACKKGGLKYTLCPPPKSSPQKEH